MSFEGTFGESHFSLSKKFNQYTVCVFQKIF